MALNPESKFGKIAQKLEFKLVLFFAYVGWLAYVWFTSGNVKLVFFAHLASVVIFAFIYFFYELVMIFFAPFFLIIWPIQNFFIRRYIKSFPLNTPTETVIFFGHSNWFTLEGWTKLILTKGEIKSLVSLLNVEKRNFSFYPDATPSDVEIVMKNPIVKEVYFFGHGDSHSFQLRTDEILYYCDFNDPKYGKKFAHQVHCGTRHGKSLIDYVVPEKNRPKCFFFRKPINALQIKKEFKRREKGALHETSKKS
jgi:hypothetical protein